MSARIRVIILLCLIVGILLSITTVAIVSFGVWLPDVLMKQENVLASAKFDHGYKVKIIQVWDTDLYKTIGRLSKPDGTTQDFLIDTDGLKLWHCQCEIRLDEGEMRIEVEQKNFQGLWRQTIVYQWNTGKNRIVKPSNSSGSVKNRY